VPSLRSDFGHPDVAVCLTCLSYYYGGLTISQVRECFELLIKLDNPPLEYEKWIKRGGDDVPGWLHQLIGVNMKDVQKFTNDIVPIFQYNQATIDFYLSQIVFPKNAKSFLQNWALLDGIWLLAKITSPQVSAERTTTLIFCPLRSLRATLSINFEQTLKCFGICFNLRMTGMSVPGVQMDSRPQQRSFWNSWFGNRRRSEFSLTSVHRQALDYYQLDKMLTIMLDAGNDEPAVGRALVIIKEGCNGRCIL
jgi:hypothetical protein